MLRIIVAVLLLLSGATAGSAQQTGTITPPAAPGANRSQRQTDGTPPPGTATLRGHVVAADTGQPIRKAQVRIFAPEIRENRLATTDESGGYEFKEVRAGRYTINATKGSYVGLAYGQQRPFDAGKPLEILDSQTVEHVDFALPRGSVVTGRIVDEFGEPVPEIQIATMRYQFIQGRRQLTPTGRFASTNDIGEFRLFGLAPGQYYLSATWRNQNFNGGGPSDRTAYAPIYFPGTTDIAQARRITLDVGQQIDDLVMALAPVKATKITGTALGSDGKPITGFLQVTQTTTGSMNFFSSGAPIRPDGTFTVNGLPPGDYTLRAQANGPPGSDTEIAIGKVTATGEDISGFALIGSKPSTASGRIIVDPSSAGTPPSNLSVSAFPLQPGPIFGPIFPAKIADDLSFELRSAPGVMRVNLNGQTQTWRIRSVRLNGVDITDTGVEFKPNEDVKGLEV